MNTKRILIAAGAALALGTLIGPVVLHAQDDDSDGIHDQLRIMTQILEASIGKDSLDRRPNLSVFDSKIRSEYIPTVGAIFTIPISFPLHPSEDEKGNGTEDVVEEDLWEHFSGASENTSRAAAPPVPPVEPLDTIEIEINIDEEGLDEQALRLYKEAERLKTTLLYFPVRNRRSARQNGDAYTLIVAKSVPYDAVKVSTLTHTIIQTIAHYGHRLKSLQNSERILVVLEAPGPRGSAVISGVSNDNSIGWFLRQKPTPAPRPRVRKDVREQLRDGKVVREKMEVEVERLLSERRRLDEFNFLTSPVSRQGARDHRLLAFKKSDLQQERSYDSIKGKVETTDY
ncbi:MAG: hypothetical protein IID09_05445 [Candidatus Hydrogenedentes bacterium]|nr:hypothetical protein [Candidatus Hydrogenedentota bacterium]